MRYMKKPVVIEAWQTGSDEPIPDWLKDAFYHGHVRTQLDERVYVVDTLEGSMTCAVGDYIIRGVRGELYPCKEDIFHETYEVTTE